MTIVKTEDLSEAQWEKIRNRATKEGLTLVIDGKRTTVRYFSIEYAKHLFKGRWWRVGPRGGITGPFGDG